MGTDEESQIMAASTSEATEPSRKIVRLHFAEGSEWSRWYGTSEAAAYLGKSNAALRSWVRRSRDAREQFVLQGIEVRRHGAGWLFRFDRSWEPARSGG